MPRRIGAAPDRYADPVDFSGDPPTLAVDCGGGGIKASVLDAQGTMLAQPVRTVTPYPLPPDRLVEEIGRASCRERVYHGVDLGGRRIIKKNFFQAEDGIRDPASDWSSDVCSFRSLAEQHLIRAEAYAQLGQVELAADDLDMIRTRAGLEPLNRKLPSFDQNELLDRIHMERRLELFCEWGHRWFDLKRTNRLDGVMAAKKEGWTSSDGLYPIPGNQLIANPALTQNPSY